MKKFKITKEQVLTIYDATSVNNQDELKQWFPDAFKTKFTGWAKDIHEMNKDWIAYYENDILKYGINANGDWFKSKSNANYNECESNKAATEREVKTALINEAVKRGYKNGNYECLDMPIFTEKDVLGDYFLEENTLWHGRKGCANVVFQNGKWATIIETITKEDAEKLLNKKIV